MAFKDAAHPPAVSRNARAPPGERIPTGAAGRDPPPGRGWAGRAGDTAGDRMWTGPGTRPGTGCGHGRGQAGDRASPLPPSAGCRPRPRSAAGAPDGPSRVPLASVRCIQTRAKPASRCTGSDRASASTGRWG